MTDPQAILCQLAERIEREDPSDALRADMVQALNWSASDIPDWLHSLDAAETLRPADWRAEIVVEGTAARCVLFCPPDAVDLLRLRSHSTAPTEARARAAAALRARAYDAVWRVTG